MSKLFGFSIEDTDDKSLPQSAVSPVPPNNEDGSDFYLSSGFFGSYVDIEGIYKTEFELIKRYREMALHPEADSAIEDIISEALVSDTNDSPVEINLDNLNASDGIKTKVREAFKFVKDLFTDLVILLITSKLKPCKTNVSDLTSSLSLECILVILNTYSIFLNLWSSISGVLKLTTKSSSPTIESKKNNTKESKVEDKTKTVQDLDREKLDKKFSREDKEKLN